MKHDLCILFFPAASLPRLVNFLSQFIKVYTIIDTQDLHVPDDDDQIVFIKVFMQ